MLEALMWGLVGSSSLVIGAVIGLRVPISPRNLGLLMGFGAGALISAVSLELAEEALADGGPTALGAGLAIGGLLFYVGDRLLERGGPDRTNRPRGANPSAAGSVLVLGALLDGLPEQAAIGISLSEGKGIGLALVAAVFLSNIPEAVASATEMRKAKRPDRQVLLLWLGVAAALTLSTLLGRALLGDAPGNVRGTIIAIAAGAVLVMLIDALVPEAVKNGGKATGLVTVVGFATAALLSHAG